MKKFGFTLSELIVAVSIIGVSAALFLPVASKLVPDTKKATVLKYYVEIDSAVRNFYSTTDNDCSGLNCTSGDSNFGEFLANELALDTNKVAPDGMKVDISERNANDGYDITLDTNGKDDSTVYSKNTSFESVDSFIFVLDNTGNLKAGDALTDAYLRNQYNWQSRAEDIKTAKSLVNKYDKDN